MFCFFQYIQVDVFQHLEYRRQIVIVSKTASLYNLYMCFCRQTGVWFKISGPQLDNGLSDVVNFPPLTTGFRTTSPCVLSSQLHSTF